MAYFERLDVDRFRATEHTAGAWELTEQHIAPALGLLAHLVEQDRDARRDDGIELGRASFDILGTVPVGDVSTDVAVLRPGRTVELVEATMTHGARDVVRLRAWLMLGSDTTSLEASSLARIDGPDETPAWDPTTVWPGGFIETAELRRRQLEPGHGAFWVRPRQLLLDAEPISDTARAIGVLDIANGMTVRADPREVAFPNVDLTAHLFRPPAGEWLGFDTRVSFGPGGIGLTASVLHDERGPYGTLAQLLTVRPR